MNVHLRLVVDVSAPFVINSRGGLGNVRHLDTNHIWIQEVGSTKTAKFQNVQGTEEIVDLLTNGFSVGDIDEHIELLGAQC